MSEVEKTCENCEYESEDIDGTHCRHCIHNAIENFKQKETTEEGIRNKAIDEFAECILQGKLMEYIEGNADYETIEHVIKEIAEQMKGGE